jgi:putative tryptophan/tyrosine transport system substrate-binding protein
MDRRHFLRTLLAGALVAPLTAEGQAGKVWQIGYLSPIAPEAGSPRVAAFRQGLRELGWVDGQNVALEMRSAEEKLDRLPRLAAELVRLKVDVIVALTNPAIDAARKATVSIPIVMVVATDPVATGFVASLARPGGNVTGLALQRGEVLGKTLQLIKQAVPNLARVAVLRDPAYPGDQKQLSEVEAAARQLRLQLHPVTVRGPGDLDGAFAAAAKNPVGAVVSIAGNIAFDHRARIAQIAIKRRLPTVGSVREYADAGWFMGYGPSLTDQYRRAATYVDKILKGAKPDDLPVEQPTKFELVINKKTARALGMTIPPSLMARADQVVE